MADPTVKVQYKVLFKIQGWFGVVVIGVHTRRDLVVVTRWGSWTLKTWRVA
jgi:hypothetical protein